MQLYCSTNPDTLRTCFLPSILSSQIVSKVDDTPAQILIALLPACQCAALFCTRVSSSHLPSKYYHRRNGAPSKGQAAVLIPVNGSVLEVGSLWMLLRWPIGWSLIRFIRRGRAREMAQLVRYLLHSIKTRIKILSTHTQVRLDGTCL